jgi:cadmium resistance protein CadD (predicted permease)
VAILEIIGIGVGGFVATDVGMALLLGVSLVTSLIAIVIPHNIIGLVGLFPIAIGIKELVELRSAATKDVNKINRLSRSRWKIYLPFLAVATVTFSGGEEIGIYTSIFVAYDDVLSEIIIIVLTVMVLTGVWCVIGFYLVNHILLATRFRSLADRVLPLVLIALGLYILGEAYLVPFFQS